MPRARMHKDEETKHKIPFVFALTQTNRPLFLLILGAVQLLIITLVPPMLKAQEPVAVEEDTRTFEIEPLEVRAQKPVSASSDQTVRDKDFMNIPTQTPSDLLRMIPGIFINQHTGGGKAHQIFLRGFDAEHGQDLAGFLNGIPLNEVSQVHGQGYLDLHFLIPESLKRIKIIKGPYLPEYGDFAVAGAVDFLTRSILPENEVLFSYGSYDTHRGLGAVSGTLGGKEVLLVAEGDRSNGFTEPGDHWAVRGLMNLVFPVTRSGEIRILTSHYSSEFDAADVVPTHYTWTGRPSVGRYGAVDPTDGGESARHLVGLSYGWQRRDNEFNLLGYYNHRKTVLYTNYTYYLFHPDPDQGDQYELWEERDYGGLRSHYAFVQPLGSMSLHTKVGLDTRIDQVHQKQSNTHERQTFNTITDYDFREGQLGAYLKETLSVSNHLQIMAGIRLDSILYDVQGTQDLNFRNICTNQADTLQDVPVHEETYQWTYSPKLAVVITPFDRARNLINSLDLFLNYGEGFYGTRASLIANLRPPDISGYAQSACVQFPTDYKGIDRTIPKARAAEGAFRLRFWKERASLAAGLWWADKEEELVFEPESGISTARGSSRRIGQEVELRVEPLTWLYLTFDFFHTQAEFQDSQVGMSSDKIPGTPELMFQHVISAHHPSGFHGALRGRYVGKRPLPRQKPLSTLYSDPYYVVDLLLGYERSRWSVELAIQNLFDTEWDDTSFSYPSSPEPNAGRPSGTYTYYEKYITPGIPLSVLGTVSFKF